MKYIFVLCTFCIVNSLYAQKHGKIRGRVFNAKLHPVDRATVSVVLLKDSLVLSYALTDEEGRFALTRIDAGTPLVLYISHVNSVPYEQDLKLKPGEELRLDSIILGGHIIGEVPVTHVDTYEWGYAGI